MKRFASALALLPLTACGTLADVTAPQLTGCKPSDIHILGPSSLLSTTWTAECHDRLYDCFTYGGGQRVPLPVACKERVASPPAPLCPRRGS